MGSHVIDHDLLVSGQLAPDPPYDMHVLGKTWEYGFSIVQVIIVLGSFVYAIRASRRGGTLIPFMCMIGGAMTIFLEPLVDAQLQVWWPIHFQPDILVIWGRNIPLMVLPVVTWYFGLNAAMRYQWMVDNGPATKLWKLYAIEVACALALEPPAIQMNLWHYYGEHGLRIFGYPVWWPFVGGACCMAAGTLVYLLAPYLTGARVLLTPFIVVMGVAAAYWGVGWPMFNVLNVEPSVWVVYLASAASIGLAFLVVWICTVATGHHGYRQEQRRLRKLAREGQSGSVVAAGEPVKA